MRMQPHFHSLGWHHIMASSYVLMESSLPHFDDAHGEKIEFKSSQVKSSQVKSSQVKSSQVTLSYAAVPI